MRLNELLDRDNAKTAASDAYRRILEYREFFRIVGVGFVEDGGYYVGYCVCRGDVRRWMIVMDADDTGYHVIDMGVPKCKML